MTEAYDHCDLCLDGVEHLFCTDRRSPEPVPVTYIDEPREGWLKRALHEARKARERLFGQDPKLNACCWTMPDGTGYVCEAHWRK